jgi:hypothetical protein
MTWFGRAVAAGRVSRVVALLVFWGLGSGLRPALARTVDSCGADARDTTANGHPRATRPIGLAHAGGTTSLSPAAPLLPVASLSGVREGVPRPRLEGSPVYRYRSSDGPSAISGLRLQTGPAQQGEAAGDSAGTRPFYRRTWFLAGAAGLAVVTAILLASGGDDDRGSPIAGASLPGFPPPPNCFMPDGVPSVATGPSR